MQAQLSDDSDNQGFISGRIQIDSSDSIIKNEMRRQNSFKLFEGKYLPGHSLMKKEPWESYYVSQDIQIKREQVQMKGKQKHIKTESQQCWRNSYNDPTKFCLVYSRNKTTMQDESRQSFENEISLKCYQNQNSQNYRKMRQFSYYSPNLQSQDSEISFDSCFQSGNLLFAYKSLTQKNTYCLFMQNDTNTYGYSQWFYFSVRNMKKEEHYRFKIVNFRKKYSFFGKGFKPVIFSLTKAKQAKNGWYRDGSSIKYYKSSVIEEGFSYFTLQFVLKCQHDNDYITISPSMPYSYTKLIDFLKDIEQIAHKRELCYHVKSIAKSLACNEIPYISLTKHEENIDIKPNIVFIARQHSGQTWSSFLLEEILKHLLLQRNQVSEYLLNNYVIRIFPMINVDGVIYGNFRCDLAGYDLNRSWRYPIPLIHDQITAIKDQLERLKNANGIQLCLDLHTHSRQLGAFAYCCSDSEAGRKLPLLFSKISPIFRYKACTFGISTGKKSTARAFIYELTKNNNVITVELSAFGFITKDHPFPVSFSPKYMKLLAYTILYGYYCYDQSIKPIGEHLSASILPQSVDLRHMTEEKAEDNQVEGSDSEPDEDQIQLNVKIESIFPKKIAEIIILNKQKYYSYNLCLLERPTKKIKIAGVNVPEKKFLKAKSIVRNQGEIKMQSCANILHENDGQKATIQSRTSKSFLKGKGKSTYLWHDKRFNKTYDKSNEVRVKSVMTSNKGFKLKNSLPLNSIDVSLSQTPKNKFLQTLNLKKDEQDDYFPFVSVKTYVKNTESQMEKAVFFQEKLKQKPKIRSYIKRHELIRESERLEQQLPHLVVISQKKREKYFARFSSQKVQSNVNKQINDYLVNAPKFNRNNGEKSFYARKQSLIIFKQEDGKIKYQQEMFKNKY